MELLERERLASSVLQKLRRKVKPLLVLIVIGILYCVAAVAAKSLIDGPNRLQICNFELTRHGCGLLSQFSSK
jgi:hypothetical protein